MEKREKVLHLNKEVYMGEFLRLAEREKKRLRGDNRKSKSARQGQGITKSVLSLKVPRHRRQGPLLRTAVS